MIRLFTTPRRLFIPVLVLFFVPVLSLWAGPQPPEPPPFERPTPPPAQVSSSEGMPPLPYPVVPMKRQERKNPPQPPVLLTKIRTPDPEDWARTPNDLKKLLQWMSKEINVHFSSNIKPFHEISTDASKNPILYHSGYKPFKLNPKQVGILREYVMNGGTIIFNALVGNPNFYQSALQAMHDILPDQPVYRLRMDHPIFHSFYEIDKVAYRERMVHDGVVVDPYPFLEGVDLDNRTAIIVSRWDLSLGWDENAHESWGYADGDAKKIGANMVCYVTAMQEAGLSVGHSVQLVDADKKNAGKFRVGQVIHAGPWKTRVAAFPMLLNQFHTATGAPVSFELRDVSLTDPAIFEMPFLYLTGTTDFAFTDEERAKLRQFLMNGGVLLAEAGEGRASFDSSFRQEMPQVLPGRILQPIPRDHALFSEPNHLSSVKARHSLAIRHDQQVDVMPELFGVEVNGSLAVIYSPYDLSAGWEKAAAPYALGYESTDATSLGVNILFYAVAH